MKKYNYFEKRESVKSLSKKGRVVNYNGFSFICDNANQADLLRKWMNAGDNFKVKGVK